MLEKLKERTNLGHILIGPFLLNLCHNNKDITYEYTRYLLHKNPPII